MGHLLSSAISMQRTTAPFAISAAGVWGSYTSGAYLFRYQYPIDSTNCAGITSQISTNGTTWTDVYTTSCSPIDGKYPIASLYGSGFNSTVYYFRFRKSFTSGVISYSSVGTIQYTGSGCFYSPSLGYYSDSGMFNVFIDSTLQSVFIKNGTVCAYVP